MRSRRADRLAQYIVRLYPHAWRERYGAEMAALLESRPATLLIALDLVRGAAGEWARQVARTAHDPVSVWGRSWHVAVTIASPVALQTVAWALAQPLRHTFISAWSEWVALGALLPAGVGVIRAALLNGRRNRAVSEALQAGRPVEWVAVARLSISRAEYWSWVVLLALAWAFMDARSSAPGLLWLTLSSKWSSLFSTGYYLSVFRRATMSGLVWWYSSRERRSVRSA